MTEISVKAKLWSLIVIMLLFIAGLGVVGFVTLDRGETTLRALVEQDDAFQDLTDKLHLNLIQLRRFEKDYFLNIGNPETQQSYLKKFQEIDAALPGLMGRLADLARKDKHLSAELQTKVAALAGLYADYREGFYDVVRRLKDDPSLAPQQANALMGRYKSDIPTLEADMAAVSRAGEQMVRQVSARAIQRARDARLLIIVAVLAAFGLAGLLGAALCRSIYRAIFREGLRRMSHRV